MIIKRSKRRQSSSHCLATTGMWIFLAVVAWGPLLPCGAQAALRKSQVQRAIKRLKQPEWRVRWRSLQLLTMVSPGQRHTPWSLLASSVASLLKDQHPMVRAAAASALRGFGPHALAALPALRNAVDDSNPMVGLQAAFAIGAIGPKAWTVAVRLTQSPSAKVQRRITMALSAFGKRALPVLATQLNKPDQKIKLYALQALVKLAHEPESKQLLPALLSGIQGQQEDLRQWSLRVLQRMGVHASAAVPTFRKLLAKGPTSVQKAAIVALGKIGPGASSALPQLRQIATTKGPLQCDAIEAIGACGKAAKAAVPQLIALLKPPKGPSQGQSCVPQTTLQAIGRMGAAASSAAAAVIGYLRHPDPQIVLEAIGAITQINAPPTQAVIALKPLLASQHLTLQTAAIKALEAFPQAAIQLVPQLGQLLSQRPPESQSYAATERQDAILKVLPKLGHGAVMAYAAGLSSPSLFVRKASINALCQMAPYAKAATTDIIKATTDSDHHIRFRAVEAIGLIGPATGKAGRAALILALKDKHHWVRYYALRSLQTLHAVDVIGRVAPLTKDPSPFVKRQAVVTLQALRAFRMSQKPSSRPASSQPATRPAKR